MSGIFINSDFGEIHFSTCRPTGFLLGSLQDVLDCESDALTCLLSSLKEDYFFEILKIKENEQSIDLCEFLGEDDFCEMLYVLYAIDVRLPRIFYLYALRDSSFC